MSPAFTARSTSAFKALIIPFAFDLISILVMGSTLPVATTDLTIVPRSTVARREASTSADAPFSVARPAAPPSTTSATAAPMYRRFRDFRAPEVIQRSEEHTSELQSH